MTLKIDKKIFSWALYDWGNSAFSTTIMAGFFPLFFRQYWSEGTDPTLTTARLGAVISIGSLLIAVMSPTLGALSDQKGTKKLFCFLFMLMGLIGCTMLGFIGAGEWFIACIAYGIAMMGFNASSVFYESLLPSIAPGKKASFASSLGYSMGYLGGGVLFALNVAMYLSPQTFGISDATLAIKYSFISVAVWWGIFSIPMFKNIPEPDFLHNNSKLWQSTKDGFVNLVKTLRKIRKDKNILFFILGYWLYIDGVYTVITMAVDFGMSIGLKPPDLITALLLVQFIGFPFALIFSFLAKRWGCRVPILICIGFYMVTVVGATLMTSATHFFIMASVIGMVQGGVQALSRSLFSQMTPEKESGEYFGLFNLVGRFASILGPLLVGMGAYLTGNPRHGMLGLLVLLGAGGILLYFVKEPTHQQT